MVCCGFDQAKSIDNSAMQILFTNGCSLIPKFNKLSFPPSIICLAETWLTPSVTEPGVSLDSCSLFRNDYAVHRRGGGVAKPLPMLTCLVIDATSPCVKNGRLPIFYSFTSHHGVTYLQKPILSRIK